MKYTVGIAHHIEYHGHVMAWLMGGGFRYFSKAEGMWQKDELKIEHSDATFICNEFFKSELFEALIK